MPRQMPFYRSFHMLATAICGLCFYGLTNAAFAYDITEIHHLDFGTFAITNNTAPHAMVVPYDGSPATYDPEIIPNTDPQRGEYALENLPPNVTFYVGVQVPNPGDGGVTMDNPTAVSGSTGPGLTVSNFTASDVTTDNNGDATLYIGATLTTSGNGAMYATDTFNGSYDITFYY